LDNIRDYKIYNIDDPVFPNEQPDVDPSQIEDFGIEEITKLNHMKVHEL
jgi:hypothetical protein